MTQTSAERIRSYRQRQRELDLPDSSRRFAKEYKRVERRVKNLATRHFVGCDGEGCGTDELGRQLYMLFRMGERELFTGRPLRTEELLSFICDEPKDSLLCGFAFGYDVTMILRDLPEKQARKLFEPKIFDKGHSRYVWYRDFDLEYLPKQYFRVRRIRIIHDPQKGERRMPIPGSSRTVFETFGFFQKSFLKIIEEFKIGSEVDRRRIADNKARREVFTEIGQKERDYCALECQFLAELMEKLREYCYAAGIVPRTWNGAGKLASALHALHHTPKSKDANLWVPKEVLDLANMAYYGGRFEITRTGNIQEKVYEYDICSAYPDAMRQLPCLCHGRWEPFKGRNPKPDGGLFVCTSGFRWNKRNKDLHPSLGALPIRSKEGHLFWPAQGNGVYWSPEIYSAINLGFEVSIKSGWRYIKECECKSFEWVEELYNYRRLIGSQGPGYPIKLGINSLYGKLAQRKGNGVYNNMVWAGLITALTRAKLNDAIRKAPASIVMLATDALYSTCPLDLDIGDNLGQWEYSELPGLFIVQPGLYWCSAKRKRKSRGLSGRFFEERGLTESFEQAWSYYKAEDNAGLARGFPEVSVPVPGFIGLKLALARNKPQTAGTWTKDMRQISFDYRNKRNVHEWEGDHIRTTIKPGYPGLVSLPHRDFLAAGGHEPWEAVRSLMDEQPDWIDFGPPFED